jgi:hypothetical protein
MRAWHTASQTPDPYETSLQDVPQESNKQIHSQKHLTLFVHQHGISFHQSSQSQVAIGTPEHGHVPQIGNWSIVPLLRTSLEQVELFCLPGCDV